MELYNWQQDALEALRRHDYNGTIKVASGKGKTILGIALISQIINENKALIVVPTIQLAHQWQQELKLFLPEKKTSLYYGAKKDESGDVVISVINTASKHLFSTTFVVKILDEVHHYGAEQFRDIFALQTNHTIGLSATPERNDEGDLAIRYGVGSIVYSLHNLNELRERFSLCTILIPFSSTEMERYRELRLEYQRMLIIGGLRSGQISNAARKGNKFALRIMKIWSEMTRLRHFAIHKLPVIERIVESESDQKIIIFSESIPYSEALGEKLPNSIVVHSNMTKKNILTRLNEFKKIKKGVLIAPRMIDEGYDVADATVSIVASFTRSSRQMIQRDGRLLRQKQKVRRYTLVIRDIEENKFAQILQQTETEEIALQGQWLTWNNGFIAAGKQRMVEELAQPERKKEWLMSRLDYFARTNQIDSDFYLRHEGRIQELIQEFPKRWGLLEKQQEKPRESFTFTHSYNEKTVRLVKNNLRKINAKVFLPEEVFTALFRYLDEEEFNLEQDAKEVLQRIIEQPNTNVWSKDILNIIHDLVHKLN